VGCKNMMRLHGGVKVYHELDQVKMSISEC
jgi:hypothetical protein